MYTVFNRLDVFAPSQELDHNVPTQQRVRAMKELHDLVATKRLEEVTDSL